MSTRHRGFRHTLLSKVSIVLCGGHFEQRNWSIIILASRCKHAETRLLPNIPFRLTLKGDRSFRSHFYTWHLINLCCNSYGRWSFMNFMSVYLKKIVYSMYLDCRGHNFFQLNQKSTFWTRKMAPTLVNFR